jgi:hypothetical protein
MAHISSPTCAQLPTLCKSIIKWFLSAALLVFDAHSNMQACKLDSCMHKYLHTCSAAGCHHAVLAFGIDSRGSCAAQLEGQWLAFFLTTQETSTNSGEPRLLWIACFLFHMHFHCAAVTGRHWRNRTRRGEAFDRPSSLPGNSQSRPCFQTTCISPDADQPRIRSCKACPSSSHQKLHLF